MSKPNLEEFSVDPKLYDKSRTLINNYINEVNKCDNLYDFYLLYSANLVFMNLMKSHFDFISETSGGKNMSKLLEEASTMLSSSIVERVTSEIFNN